MQTPIRRIQKALFVGGGVVSLSLGILGLFVPLLPTTCFVLLAGFCFSKGSDPLHDWILNHRRFGPSIRDWRTYGVIRVPIKCWASLMIFVSGLVMWVVPQIPFWVQFGTSAFFVALVGFIWSRPHEIPKTSSAVVVTR
ncbi:MAG: YbaN family protein [Bdellovibrionales bacterium]